MTKYWLKHFKICSTPKSTTNYVKIYLFCQKSDIVDVSVLNLQQKKYLDLKIVFYFMLFFSLLYGRILFGQLLIIWVSPLQNFKKSSLTVYSIRKADKNTKHNFFGRIFITC